MDAVRKSGAEPFALQLNFDTRRLVLIENPSLVSPIMEGGFFGKENFSVSAAQNILELAGVIDALILHINEIKEQDLALAFEIYRQRIIAEGSLTQEMLVYLDHMTEIRAKM